MKVMEMRHILAAYLLTGSMTKAARILGICQRTIRTRLRPIRRQGRHGKTLTKQIMKETANAAVVTEEQEFLDEFDYPSHRDFEFWDWYMNQDYVRVSSTPSVQPSRHHVT